MRSTNVTDMTEVENICLEIIFLNKDIKLEHQGKWRKGIRNNSMTEVEA